jgi:putative ABC transport system permease protein
MSKVASIRLTDLIPLAWGSLRRNRLRSTLTVGAIAVGIGVMVYLISLGLGLQMLTVGSVERSSSLLAMTVNSGNAELFPLNGKALAKAKAVGGIREVLPRLSMKGTLALDSTGPVTVVGVDPDYLQITDATQLVAGQYYRPEDTQVIIVTTGLLKLFGLEQKKVPLVTFKMALDADKYGDVAPIDVNVTGVVDDTAAAVYVPRPYLEQLITNRFDSYEHFKIIVKDLNSIGPVRDGLIAQAFRVTTVVDTVDQIQSFFKWVTGVLATLGLIAIFVASIGMFNTLTISLLERTREIGIMKALGVKKTDISRLFIFEAVLMGLVGGILGITIAVFFQQLTVFGLQILASLSQGTVPTLFVNHWILVSGALVFAVLIASLTGIYPARRATKLNPIDAIRHE